MLKLSDNDIKAYVQKVKQKHEKYFEGLNSTLREENYSV